MAITYKSVGVDIKKIKQSQVEIGKIIASTQTSASILAAKSKIPTPIMVSISWDSATNDSPLLGHK